MKFCDKLPKLRKENNLSQELLADKLGVSRQAVSKWESGSSYPDMEKMIDMFEENDDVQAIWHNWEMPEEE